MVVPDNVLFADEAADVFKVLVEDCDLHTVLRCPRGTFTPYSPGTKTNVIFFTKGLPTKNIWIYDARANVPAVTKKDRPLTPAHFAEFEACFGDDPNGRGPRTPSDSAEGRWRQFAIEEVRERRFKLEGFKWIRDDEAAEMGDVRDPEELVDEAIEQLRLAVDELADLQRVLADNGDTRE
jgi:type I restriction enzyme M protein